MRVRPWWKIGLIVAAMPLLAQEGPVPSNTARLILVPFHVVKDGHQVAGLTPDDVVLFEDGAPRKISYFAGPAQGSLNALFADKPPTTGAPTELVVLLNTTGGSNLGELRFPQEYHGPPIPPEYRPSMSGLADPQAAFAAWLRDAFLDIAVNSRIAVYGFDRSLLRYCRQTRDPKEITAAIRAADKGSRGNLILQGDKRRSLSWDEAITGTVQDAAAEPEDAIRILLPFLRGLPSDGLRPHAVAGVCQDLGITAYPMFRDVGWPAFIRRYTGKGYYGIGPAEPGNASEWDKMKPNERGAWLSMKEREFAEYGKLGDETGGRSDDPHLKLESVLDDIELRVRSVYAAGFMPETTGGVPKPHKLEVRLRDPGSGVLQGGTRVAAY